jgi:hypothetical protein
VKIPQHLAFPFILASLMGEAAIAAWELNALHRATSAAHAIAAAFGPTGPVTATVSVNLFIGLIPMGRVNHPFLVIAVCDFLLGALAVALAILLVYTVATGSRRKTPS